MGWMPDCRACAWRDGTLALEWRREARKAAEDEYAWRMSLWTALWTQLAQLGVGNPAAEVGAEAEQIANDRSRNEAIRQSYEAGIIRHGPGYCVPYQPVVAEPILRPWWRHLTRGR